MILTIDIGNSSIAAGCFDKERLLFIERISTNAQATAIEYIVVLRNVLEINGIKPAEIEGGIIASVVPSVTGSVKSAVEAITGREMLILDSSLKTGLSVAIDDPSQLGADFTAAAVAGVSLYEAPIIIIDMNTATTVAVVDKNRCFIGGMIIPGAQTSLEALISRTSQLPSISLSAPKRVIGTNTVDSMKSGYIYSNASAVDGIIRRIENELGESCTVVATGDCARAVIPHCTREIIIEDDLLLKGLNMIYTLQFKS